VIELTQWGGTQSVGGIKSGVPSAPPKLGKTSLDEFFEMDDQNFKHKPKEVETKEDSLSIREDDRVQGLSGNHLTTSEDDLLSEEGQASQIDKHVVGMAKSSNSDF
jgi:hypothetical protein